MRDPFRSDTKKQLIREAQIGLSVVGILLALFLYVAFKRISGHGRLLPEHVRSAPIAETVWPAASLKHELSLSTPSTLGTPSIVKKERTIETRFPVQPASATLAKSAAEESFKPENAMVLRLVGGLPFPELKSKPLETQKKQADQTQFAISQKQDAVALRQKAKSPSTSVFDMIASKKNAFDTSAQHRPRLVKV